MTRTTFATLALAAGAVFATASVSHAQLAHRYSFDSDASDSVGGADGTLLGGTIAGGSLTTGSATTPAGNGQTNGVSLPSGAVAGLNGSFTIQSFIQPLGFPQTGFRTAFAFSGVDGANGTTGANFTAYTLVRGENSGAPGFNSSVAVEEGTAAPQALLLGPPQDGPGSGPTLKDVVFTYDAPSGTGSYYVNGTFLSSASLPDLDLSTQGAKIGINGNAPFLGDNSLTGSTLDFRIIRGALSQAQVTALDGLGADASTAAINAAVPEPVSLGLLGLGGLGLLTRRRRTA